MNTVPLPTDKNAQNSRKELIRMALKFIDQEIKFEDLFYQFLSACHLDPPLQASPLFSRAIHLNQEHSSSDERIRFSQELSQLPLCDETDPYCYCENDEETTRRKMVIDLQCQFPEIRSQDEWDDALNQNNSFMVLGELANNLNRKVSEKSVDQRELSLLFKFIASQLDYHDRVITNVIAVGFLEHLDEKYKEIYMSYMDQQTRELYLDLLDHLDHLFQK